MTSTLLEPAPMLEPDPVFMPEPALEPEPMRDEETIEFDDWAMERARNGAAWLDSRFGTSWDRKIDLNRLDIGTSHACVLGQLVGHGYFTLLFPTRPDERGFSLGALDFATMVLPIQRFKRCYEPLNVAWKQLIRERRGEG